MELWQLNACVRAYNEQQEGEGKLRRLIAWQTANWTGAAFAGKLRKFSHYERGSTAEYGRSLTREEMDDFDRRLTEKQRKEAEDGAI